MMVALPSSRTVTKTGSGILSPHIKCAQSLYDGSLNINVSSRAEHSVSYSQLCK